MALVARGITHVYDAGTPFAVPALSSVDLTLERGTVALVIGPSGSGKSTLLEILSGLLRPSEGSVLADGRDIFATPSGRPPAGLVFQNPESQLFAETVEADVAFGPRNLGLPAEEIAARTRSALEQVGLPPEEFGPRSPFTLSGGEARRAAIAGVLAMRPAYVLLDEPTAGLDATARAHVLGVLKRIREHSGVLVVTHDPEELLGIADALVVVAEGRVAASGPLDALLVDPAPAQAAGVRLPEVVRVQQLAAERGARLPRIELDPEAAAAGLLEASRRPS